MIPEMNELISVVIPAYNAGRFLADAIESVLAQTHRNLEIIVVDDGSTDDTATVARDYDIRYIYQENAGVSGAMNTGFRAASGDYLASNDADDLWLPDKLAVQLEAFREEPVPDIVFAHIEQFICPTLEGTDHGLLLPDNARVVPGYSSQSMLIRRDAFQRVGYFSTAYQVGDFVEWYARAEEAGLRTRLLPGILSRRRIHGSNTGIEKKHSQTDYLRILKASLDRRRGHGSGNGT